jgi:hypothetical protein
VNITQLFGAGHRLHQCVRAVRRGPRGVAPDLGRAGILCAGGPCADPATGSGTGSVCAESAIGATLISAQAIRGNPVLIPVLIVKILPCRIFPSGLAA